LLEDLHWADEASATSALSSGALRRRILIIATLRGDVEQGSNAQRSASRAHLARGTLEAAWTFDRTFDLVRHLAYRKGQRQLRRTHKRIWDTGWATPS
jgi:hypothetical protein